MSHELARRRFCTLGRHRRALLAVLVSITTVALGVALAIPGTASAQTGPSSPTLYCAFPGSTELIPCYALFSGPGGTGTGTYTAPDLLPNPGPLTSAEATALQGLEDQAVANTIADHQLASTDGPAVLSWGRADAEAELWALLVQAAKAPNPTPDQQGAVDWLVGMVQGQAVAAAQDAGLEYAKWAGLGVSQYESLLRSNPSLSDLQAFLGQTPEPEDPYDTSDQTQGYCGYTAPSPDSGDWANGYSQGLQTCYQPCTDYFTGCAPPTPSFQQFEQWGEADVASADGGTYNSPEFAVQASQISGEEAFGWAVTGTAGTVALTPALAAAVSNTWIEAALWPTQSDLALNAALSTGSTVAAAVRTATNLAQVTAAVTPQAAGGGAAGAEVAAEATTVAGWLTAAMFTSIASIVVLAVTIGVTQGINVFNAAALPGQLAGGITDMEGYPDDALALETGLPTPGGGGPITTAAQYLSYMLTIPAEGFSLYSMFVAATLGNGLVACSSADLSATTMAAPCDAPPLPSTYNEQFSVTAGVSSTPEQEDSITWADGADTDSASVNGDWFVETQTPQGGSPITSQTLGIRYTDWSGIEQNAWLEATSNGLSFVGFPTPSSSQTTPLDPATCATSAAPGSGELACWSGPSIYYIGPDGNHYSATVIPAPIAIGATVPTTLTATVTTDTASVTEGSTQTFDASAAFLLPGGGVASDDSSATYTWRFQEPTPPPPPGTIADLCATLIGGTYVQGPCWGAPQSGADVSHTWTTSGVYEVQLTATDPVSGQSSVDTFPVDVADVAPQLELGSSCPGGGSTVGIGVCPTSTMSLSGALTHAGSADYETVAVDWGDGTTGTISSSQTSSGPLSLLDVTPTTIDLAGTHTYTKPGLYQITVTATDQSGTETSATTYAIEQATQSISFTSSVPTSAAYGGGPVHIQAAGGMSPTGVVLASATPSVCTISNVLEQAGDADRGLPAVVGAQVNVVGAGTCTITANQSGTYFDQIVPGFNLDQPEETPVFSAAPQAEQSFTVDPAPLTITPSDQAMAYGGTAPAFSATYSGFVSGDTQSVVSGLSCGPVDAGGNPLDPGGLAVGTYTTTCWGASAANYTVQYGTGTLTVSKAATSTSLSSKPGSSVWGQSVTFTAGVKPAGTGDPTGTVEFKDGASDIAGCSAQPVDTATEAASCTTSALAVGSHQVTATYGGDSNFIGSTASSAQKVSTAGTGTEVSSADPGVMAGQPATFTATVTAEPPGAGTPSGTVTFYDGATELGTGQLNASGQATYQTSSLGLGPHSVTASYGGDGDFDPSTSPAFTQYIDTSLSHFPELPNGAYNLSGANLSGGYFAYAPLAGANLAGSNLKNTVFIGASLTGASLSRSNFAGANLTNANLTGANLSRSNFAGANLTNANLTGANLSYSNFAGANFSGADLATALIVGSNLKGANLSNANLAGTQVSLANVAGVTWANTTCPDGTVSNADGGSCLGHL
ncbi:MAG: Ig-like domain repeat protein [Streptosporangiaceae bacterium]